MKNTNEINTTRKMITDPYTLELVRESPAEYRQRMAEMLKNNDDKDEIIKAILDLKNTGTCSFVPFIAGFMIEAGLLGQEHDKNLGILIEVIEETK